MSDPEEKKLYDELIVQLGERRNDDDFKRLDYINANIRLSRDLLIRDRNYNRAVIRARELGEQLPATEGTGKEYWQE